MKKILPFLLLICGFVANASTSITTPTVSGHWTLAGSPYNIYNNILIPSGSTLTVDPGVSVVFYGPYKLSVSGDLIATGTAAQQINFTVHDTTGYSVDNSTSNGGWYGISYQWATATDTSSLQYCNISYIKLDSAGYVAGNYGAIYTLRTLVIKNCSVFKCRSFGPYPIDIIRYDYFSIGLKELNSCSIHDNSSPNGHIFFSGNSVGCITNIHNCTFNNNNSISTIYVSAISPLLFDHNEMYQNQAISSSSASGILTIIGNAKIRYNKIHDNACQKDAAIVCMYGFVDIIGNMITNNQSLSSSGCGILDGGGALDLMGDVSTPGDSILFTIKDNIIANNYSAMEGGAIKINHANATITNNQIINNSSNSGGGLYIVNDPGNFIIRNNIFFGNTEGAYTSAASCNVKAITNYARFDYTHNWIENFTNHELYLPGIGNTLLGDTTTNIIGTNPGLFAPTLTSSVTESALLSNFGLLASSPCINRGDTAGIGADPVDYYGHVRISGSTIDIGACEWQSTLGIIGSVPDLLLNVYPNPATNTLFISTPKNNGTIALLDLSGRKMAEKNVSNTITTIDIQMLPRGIYFAVWNDGNGEKAVQKVVVE